MEGEGEREQDRTPQPVTGNQKSREMDGLVLNVCTFVD